jgi:uncharacterized protein YecT (DUF1311 family)
LRTVICLLCFFHGMAFAADDPVLVETAKRLRMPLEVVREHHLTGCESGNPNEQHICGSYGFTKEDLELNRIYATLVSELKDKESRTKLAAAQLAWIRFRDRACEFEADGYSRSRDMYSVVANCKATYTKARSDQLKAFVGCGELYGCPGYKW